MVLQLQPIISTARLYQVLAEKQPCSSNSDALADILCPACARKAGEYLIDIVIDAV